MADSPLSEGRAPLSSINGRRKRTFNPQGWRRAGKVRWRFEFKVADCWIGVYWAHTDYRYSTTRDIWICFLPTVPLHLRWTIREWTESDFEPDAIGSPGGQLDYSRHQVPK